MSQINPRSNLLNTLNSYKYPPELNKDRGVDLEKYGNIYKYSHDSGQGRNGYKYQFYRDYNENSKESAPMDSLRHHERGDQFNIQEEPANYPPSFRRKPPSQHPSYREQIMDSVQYAIQPPQINSKSSIQSNRMEVQSQQILFLKDKLIQTHNKLIKQLEQTNRLNVQLQTIQSQLQAQHKQNQNLQLENERLRKQINMLLSQKQGMGKSQQKFKSLENKYQEENKRNTHLKEDLENMRNKMLETLMLKNNFEEENNQLKAKMNNIDQVTNKLKAEIREKQQAIEYLSKQLEIIRKKYDQCEQECQHRAQQIHQYNHLATEREKALNAIQIQLKREKQRTTNGISQFSNLQAEHKAVLKRLAEVEDMCEKYKSEIYWLENNKQTSSKAVHEQLEKLTNQLNAMNTRYKQKQRQLEMLRKRPIIEAEKKKKNYENTREFVNKLESQQYKIEQSTTNLRGPSKGNNKTMNSNVKMSNNVKTTRNGRSPSHSPYKGQQNPITHQPISHIHSSPGYQQQKGKYMQVLDQVGDLEANLLNSNMEKKRMLTQMDKIDDTKVKTKQMINRRRKLEEDLAREQEKIKRVKEQLRKAKAL